jgi:hypothetical protein
MEIVTRDPAPMLDREEAARLLHEMAAVVRTVFAVSAPAGQPTPASVPVEIQTAPTSIQAVPSISMPTAIPVAGLPVPSLPLPAPEATDSAERHSMALLQEIAFLDD